jgi:hypothetical protein
MTSILGAGITFGIILIVIELVGEALILFFRLGAKLFRGGIS